MSDPIGHEILRAMPIHMTFYDSLVEYPYTATFYVKENTPDEASHRLIRAIQKMSSCVLGKYRIGHRPFVVPNAHELLQDVSPYSMGTFKWRISYHSSSMQTQSHTIPGRKIEHSLGGHTTGLKKRADDAYMKHEDWVAFLDVFREVGVSILGEPIPDHVVIKMSKSNWPPKGWKKKR